MKDYYFDAPVFGRVACVIQARSQKEARARFEEGSFGELIHAEFVPVLTKRDRAQVRRAVAEEGE